MNAWPYAKELLIDHGRKVPLTMRALIARINRKLAKQEECLKTSRGAYLKRQLGAGAALLEHYVCVISPVEDESLSPDVAQLMYVSVRWPWRSELHGAA